MVDKIILWHLFKFRQVPLYWIKKRDLSQAEGAEESLLGVQGTEGFYPGCETYSHI